MFFNSIFVTLGMLLTVKQNANHYKQIVLNAQNKPPCSKRLNSQGTYVNEPQMVDESISLRTRITGYSQKIVVERTLTGITSWIEFVLVHFANMIAAFCCSVSVVPISISHLFLMNKYRLI